MVLRPTAAPFTWDDVLEMPDDGYRRELVHGQLLVTPSPVGLHQRAVAELHFVLRSARPPDLDVLTAPYDWKRSEGTVLQPDLLVFRRVDFQPHGWLSATPLLVVEIASTSTAVTDRTLKRAVYEEAGVPSYWLVDPVEPSL
ncbi:MAG: Uma2 family endonuclease, partial [Acidimicrobiales bacterium]